MQTFDPKGHGRGAGKKKGHGGTKSSACSQKQPRSCEVGVRRWTPYMCYPKDPGRRLVCCCMSDRPTRLSHGARSSSTFQQAPGGSSSNSRCANAHANANAKGTRKQFAQGSAGRQGEESKPRECVRRMYGARFSTCARGHCRMREAKPPPCRMSWEIVSSRTSRRRFLMRLGYLTGSAKC